MRTSPETSISIASERVHANGAAPSSPGVGVIVTGTSPHLDDGIADEVGNGSPAWDPPAWDPPAWEKRRRHPETWFAFTSYCRATSDTDAPGRDAAATISRFNASGQRRRFAPRVSISAIARTFPPAETYQRQHVESAIKQIPTRRCSPEEDSSCDFQVVIWLG
jgi:hypothetical protein